MRSYFSCQDSLLTLHPRHPREPLAVIIFQKQFAIALKLGAYPHSPLKVPAPTLSLRARLRAICKQRGFRVPMLKAWVH